MDMSKYLGILRWSLQYQDGTSDNAQPMDPERRKWLQEALASQVVDPIDQLKQLIKVLEMEPRDDEAYEDGIVETLRLLRDWVESMDWAQDLYKIGGYHVVIKLLASSHMQIRAAACEIVGTVVQNNPACQDWSMELGVLPLLVNIFSSSEKLEQRKSLMAIGSLIRCHTKATISFVKEYKGVALLVNVCKNPPLFDESTVQKAIALLNYLIETIPAIKIASAEYIVECSNIVSQIDNPTICEFAMDNLKLVYCERASKERVSSLLTESVSETLHALSNRFPDDEELIETIRIVQDSIVSSASGCSSNESGKVELIGN